jgi:hypothetical protein
MGPPERRWAPEALPEEAACQPGLGRCGALKKPVCRAHSLYADRELKQAVNAQLGRGKMSAYSNPKGFGIVFFPGAHQPHC